MLTKQAFIDKKPLVLKIEIPAWEDFVYIKKMSAGERVQLTKAMTKVEGKTVELNQEGFMDSIVKTLQIILCDENGIRIFNDSQEDFDILNSKDGEILEKIFDEAMTFSGLGEDAEKEAIKNSDSSLI
jgi:hypothetical protein